MVSGLDYGKKLAGLVRLLGPRGLVLVKLQCKIIQMVPARMTARFHRNKRSRRDSVPDSLVSLAGIVSWAVSFS